MEFSQIYPFVIPFITGQLAGILAGLYIDKRSWKSRTTCNGASFVCNYVVISTILLLAAFILPLKYGDLTRDELVTLSRVFGGALLAYISLVIPSWCQTRQFRISLQDAYFGTMHQLHVMVIASVGGLIAYAIIPAILFATGLATTMPPLLSGFWVFLAHFTFVFYMMAFARPFWTRELSRLRQFFKRH